MIVLALGLLIVCIVLAIVLAIILISTSTPTATASTVTDGARCGIQEITPRSTLQRIYGGAEAIPNSWPWIVFYAEMESCNDSVCPLHTCGGTLIDPQYVLTAAHCITSTNDSVIGIIAGLHNTTSIREGKTHQTRVVQKVFLHPTYNETGFYENDIAILQLSSPFNLTKYVQLACLPGAQPQVNDSVIIAGWGSEVYGGASATVLKQAFTQVIEDCNTWWSSEQADETRQICVANSVMGDSACHGDSGGPLLAKDVDRWVVSGVTSFGEKFNCNTNNSAPNVFTRVAHYLPWINNIIQLKS